MDLFKSCTTSVHLIEGFSVIHYRCYELPTNAADLQTAGSPQCLHGTMGALRAHGILVIATSKTRLLLFGQSQDKILERLAAACPNQNVQEMITCNEDMPALRVKAAGSMTAKDLLQDPSFPAKAEASMTTVDVIDITQTAIEQTITAAQCQSPTYYRQMHRSFISACVRSVVFQLSKTGKAVPFNFRSIVFLPEETGSSDLLAPHRASLAGLELSLTAKGDVLVSMRVAQDVLIPMSSSSMDLSRKMDRVVRIAPSGRLAKVVRPAEQHVTQPETALSSSKFSGEGWRSSVVEYLKACGSEAQTCFGLTWCQLRFCESATDEWSFLDGLDENCRHFEWPASFCFAYPEKIASDLWRGTLGKEDLPDEGLVFFEDKSGFEAFKDPVDEAIRFHTGFLQETENAHQGQEHSLEQKSLLVSPLERTTDDMDWEPPQQSYTVTQDMAKAMAVYPTPPDGLLPLGAHAVAAQGPKSNLRTIQDDEYSAASITEADFSFFDDPSPDPAMGLESASEPQVVKSEVIPGSAEQLVPSRVPLSKLEAIPADNLSITQISKQVQLVDRRQSPGPSVATDCETVNALSTRPSRPVADLPWAKTLIRLDDFSTSLDNVDSKYDLNGRFAYFIARRPATSKKAKPTPGSKASMSDPHALSRSASLWKSVEQSTTRHQAVRSPSNSDSDSDADMYPNKRGKPDCPGTLDTQRDGNEIVRGIGDSVSNTASESESEIKLRNSKFLDVLCATSDLDWSLTDFTAPSAGRMQPRMLNMLDGVEYVEVVQLLSAQLSLSTRSEEHSHLNLSGSHYHMIEEFLPILQRSLKNAFSTSTDPSQQDSLSNLEIAKVARSITTTSKFQPKPKVRVGRTGDIQLPGQSSEESSAFAIETPVLHVRKDDGDFEILPSAWTMWNTLGLAPCNGPKKVTAVCAYPACRNALDESVRAFFRSMRSAWMENKLGSHDLLGEVEVLKGHVGDDDEDDDGPQGLLRVNPMSPVTMTSIMAAYHERLMETRLEEVEDRLEDGDIVVVYMVNPFDTESAMFDLVTCFHALWKDLEYHPGLVLQIIPMDFITTTGGPTFLDPTTLSLLAREVYDRCPLETSRSDLPITTHNAIELAPDPVEDIRFRLTVDAPHDIMHEKSCLHIAYALDDNWITVAWTDNIGKYQHQASYHMSSGQSFSNILHEIWSSTMEYIAPQKALWRLFVVSTAPMTLVERKTWRNLAVSAKTQPIKFSLTLVSINTSPLVEYYPKTIEFDQFHHRIGGDMSKIRTIVSPNISSTPHNPFSPTTPSNIATPRSMADATRPFSNNIPGISSSSPVTQNMPTPANVPTSLDHDPNARIIDFTDETCGLILARHLNVSPSITYYHPALASGYLFKRGGVRYTDRPVLLEVNIMAVDLTAAAMQTAGASAQSGPSANTALAAQKLQQPPPSRLPQRPNLALPAKPPTPLSSNSMFAAPSSAASTFPSLASTTSTPASAPTPLSEADKSALRQRRYDAALREILVMYRKLAVLAKMRGLQGADGTAPWHVIVATRAAEGLRRCVGAGLPGKVTADADE